MKGIKLFFFIFIFKTNMAAQVPTIQWQKSYGGTRDDVAYSSCNTKDGGFMLVGDSYSEDGDVLNHFIFGISDVWVLKLDSLGNVKWKNCFGGTGSEDHPSIKQTFDNGFIIASSTTSDDGDVTGLHMIGRPDFWVVKIDSTGIIQWQKCLGSTEDDEAADIIQTADSGYLVTGYVSWLDGDVVGFHGEWDMWVVKLSKDGEKQWSKSLGGSDFDWGTSCVQTKDGGYLIGGSTASVNGDVSGLHGLGVDSWVVKLNYLGQLQWQKCYGGTRVENSHKIILTKDGGFFISSTTGSSDGDVTGNHGNIDYWLVKADSIGNIEWQKCYGGTSYQSEGGANSTSDGGVVMIGIVYFDDSIVTGTHGGVDYWVCKVDSSGNFQWGKTLGGTEDDIPYSIQETPDGGYLVAGYTSSIDGDVTSNHGGKDYWIVKLAPLGLTVPELENSFMELNIFQSNNQLNLRYFSKHNQNAQLFLYDVNSKKVFEKSISVNEGINYNTVSTTSLAAGMYFVRMDGEKGWQSEKIVIQ